VNINARLAKLEREHERITLKPSGLTHADTHLADFYGTPEVRETYPKHMEFFEAGAKYRERAFMAANRVGKSEGGGGYELSLHLTGLYPDWWKGRRFETGLRAIAAGETNILMRDSIQRKLFGPTDAAGSGLIPKDLIKKAVPRSGVRDAWESVTVAKADGSALSWCKLMSYEQGRKVFQADEMDIIWLDEEPDIEIYNECLVRTMTTGGIVMLTYTPLRGITETVMSFLPGGELPKAA